MQNIDTGSVLLIAVGCAAFGRNFRGETDLNTPLLVRFDPGAEFKFSPDIVSGWHEACIAECGHQRKSNFRKHHEPVVYRAVMDAGYRSWILDQAFEDE